MWDPNNAAGSIHFKVFGIVPESASDKWECQEFYEKFLEIFSDQHNGVAEFWVFQEKGQDDLSPVVYECLRATSIVAHEHSVQCGGTTWEFSWGLHEFVGRWCFLRDSGGLMSGCNGGQLMVLKDLGESSELATSTVETYFGNLFEFAR